MKKAARRKAPAIVLAMMVKNERHVIHRALESVLPVISRYVIVDTGSTDDTATIAKELLSEKKGEILARPWTGRAQNRTELVAIAREKGDWLLLADADEVFEIGGVMPDLRADGYELRCVTEAVSSMKLVLVRASLPWSYVGEGREALVCPEPHRIERSDWARIVHYGDGFQSRRDPYERRTEEAERLRHALERDPFDTRAAFHFAEALRLAGDLQGALAAYEHRVRLGGWDEETFWALLQIAKIHEHRATLTSAGTPTEEAAIPGLYLRAYAFRPMRPEPLVELARYYRERGEWKAALLFAERAVAMPCVEARQHPDRHFVDQSILDWRAMNEHALAAYYVGEYEKALTAWTNMLARVPAQFREQTEQNLEATRERLAELESLRQQGLVSDAEYASKRQEILSGL